MSQNEERNATFDRPVHSGTHRHLETCAHVHREPNGKRVSFHQESSQKQAKKRKCDNSSHFKSQRSQTGQQTGQKNDSITKYETPEFYNHLLKIHPRRANGMYTSHYRCFFIDPSAELRRIQIERYSNSQNRKETSKTKREMSTTDKPSNTSAQIRSVGHQNRAFVMEEFDHTFQLVPLQTEKQEDLIKNVSNGNAYYNSGRSKSNKTSKEFNSVQWNPRSGKEQETQTTDSEREQPWTSKYDLFVVTITYMLGLGNVLRFSKLCHENGGGAFLIPYLIMLVLAGIPLVCLEMSLGQRAGHQSPLKSWQSLGPRLKWIGLATVMNSLICSFYYCLIVTWCLYYFCFSLTSTLPWKSCPSATETGNKSTILTVDLECASASPAEYFWFRSTLDTSDDMNHINGFNGKLFGFILVSWTLVWLLVMKGLRSASRALYVLLILIITLLVVLFFAGVHLEGWAQGLAVFLIPQTERLKDPQVWLDAAGQIVFSLGIGYGGISTFASLNRPKNDFFTDSIICALANTGTSIWASIIMFSFFGFKARYQSRQCLDQFNSTVSNHSNCDMNFYLNKIPGGTSLAFVGMSEAFAMLDSLPSFWSALFYLLLFLLGSTSMLGMLQVVYATIVEIGIVSRHWRQEIVYGGICLGFCVTNLVFCQSTGYYLQGIIDNSATIPLLLVALFECLGVSYFYGINRYNDDVRRLTGKDISRKWKVCWQFISPLIALGLVIMGIVKIALRGGFTYSAWDRSKATEVIRPYPHWAYVLYAIAALIPTLFLIVVPLKYCCTPSTCQSRVHKLYEAYQSCMESRSGSYEVKEETDSTFIQGINLNGHI